MKIVSAIAMFLFFCGGVLSFVFGTSALHEILTALLFGFSALIFCGLMIVGSIEGTGAEIAAAARTRSEKR